MSRKTQTWLGSIVIIALLLGGLAWMTNYYTELPFNLSQHETIILGQSQLVPGSEAALRVVVRDSSDVSPIANAKINVSLKPDSGETAVSPITLFSGTTNQLGTADIVFTVPDSEESDYTLIVETESELGSDVIERPLTLTRDYRILLTTDKPLYQPGQIIHLRGLALSSFDRVPAANQPLEISIADGKGNTVFRDTVTTSEFGVASTNFQLAGEVNTGPYKISAQLGNSSSEKTVTVENYILPKFEVSLTTEKPYYQPGETVRGTVAANYFFGKTVANSQVELEGFTFDFERTDVFAIQGETDAQGNYSFEFQLPDFIAGTDLDGGMGAFYVQGAVTDQTNRTESSSLSFPVASSNIIIEAIPESGDFRPGVENILYVLTSSPDGRPLQSELTIDFNSTGEQLTAVTGPYGLAEIRFVPNTYYQDISIQASSATGAVAQQEFYFEGKYAEESVLLRLDQPIYRVGDSMSVTILTNGGSRTAYLDIVREGQTVSTRAVPIQNGQAQLAVDVSPDLFGTLELHAYTIPRSGNIIRDTRLVLVEEANDLSLTFAADKEVYRPGETAVIDIQVNGEDSTGAESAIGLAIVDESVFALTQQDPGFAKLYFMLEQQLLQPKYDLHGFSIPDLLTTEPVAEPELRAAQEGAAKASLADAAQTASNFGLSANSHEDAVQLAKERQENYFTNLTLAFFLIWSPIPLIIIGIVGVALWRKKKFWHNLGAAIGAIVVLIGLGFTGIYEPLFELLFWYGNDDIIAAILGLFGLSLIGLLIIAWRRKETVLRWMLGLGILFILIGIVTTFAANESRFDPPNWVLWMVITLIALIPMAYFMQTADYLRQKRWGTAVLATIVSFATLMIPLGGLATGLGGMGGFAQPQVDFAVEEMALADVGIVVEFEEAPVEQPTASSTDGSSAGEPPRLRQFFPETMLWLPDGETDASGLLTLDVPVADSITTWRMTALASTQDGRLGTATGSLRVFQDFFIDLDLPLALTVGDEIAVPVGVFNYLPDAQTVTLTVKQENWFELLDESEKSITVEPNEITVVYFRIRALEFGKRPFQVSAIGTKMSDAILKSVRVYPDGKEIRTTASDRLTPDQSVSEPIFVPTDATPGTQSINVKIYPGVVSQVVEGLDSILRLPNGCFEQTSSTTYPNVLILDYLQASGQTSPELQFKAENFINIGYQRLTTFEVSGGGFSLFGNPPSDRMLTAYGLQEFADMSRVYDVDQRLIDRAAEWLLSEQLEDGSWENDTGLVHESTWSNLENDRLPVTAYIIWSLIEAGYRDAAGTQIGIAYLREHQQEAQDPYVLALLANALTADLATDGGEQDALTLGLLDRLAGLAVREGETASPREGAGAVWNSGVATFIGSEGATGSIETTALVALAFLRAEVHPQLTNEAITALIQQKDSFGTWYNTQSTVLALKALIATVRTDAESVNATVTIQLNSGQTRTVQVTPETFDVVQMVTFDDVNLGDNIVSIDVQGEGNLMYQVTSSYYLPWESLADYPDLVEPQEAVTIDVAYDRTELAVNESVTVDVTVSLNEAGARTDWALIDLGIPPGFTVNAEDLTTLVEASKQLPPDADATTFERYELTGRQVLVYLGNLQQGKPFSFSYRLTAKFPLRAQTPASTAYDYYNPTVSGEAQPQEIVVVEE